ncbi:MAG: sugar transferase [Epsilonproteobacteria bacterium]|nr:sugar transferase [Campylobacterota bacterium]
MIVLGEKYQFNQNDLEKLKDKFSLKLIPYKNSNPKEVIEKIESLLKENSSVIVLNTKEKVPSEIIEYLTSLELKGIEFLKIEHFLEKYLNKIYIPKEIDSDISFLEEIKPYNKFQYFQKRILDYIFAVPLGLITIPVMLYAAYRIKKESPEGPIIFKQKRVGINGEEFVCYKFRSMVPDAEKGKPQFASKDDPRVFKWGAIMRKTRIDELPQLWNVIKGDMHFVGPRPERKYWVDQFKKTIPSYDQRHLVKPGITGWAQVNYPYGENEEDARQKLMYDLYYIKHWSLLLEFKTILKTFSVIFSKKGQ